MKLIADIKDLFIYVRCRYKDKSAVSIIWLMNLMPSWAGFSMTENTPIRRSYWIVQFALLSYLYFWSSAVSTFKHAQGVADIILSYVNIISVILTTSATHLFLKKRKLIKSVLETVIEIDKMSCESEFIKEKHAKVLTIVKKIVCAYFFVIIIDVVFLYMPQRLNLSSGIYGSDPCAGMTLTSPLSRNLCVMLYVTQDVFVIIVINTFQVLLLFLIAHTSAMFLLLAEEMIELGRKYESEGNYTYIKVQLPLLIRRHGLILQTINHLKSLYSNPLGINFGLNAIFMCLFFYLPLHQWIAFIPMLLYCAMVFFLYCYLCQNLVNASEVFEMSVYACGWEKFELAEKKMIYITLKLAQRPVKLLAADIIPVNMYTFAYTLKSIFKFVTIIKV